MKKKRFHITTIAPNEFKKLNGCKVEGCTEPPHAKGYCACHYGQVWRKGKTYERAPAMNPGKHLHIRMDDGTIAKLRKLQKGWKCTVSEAVRRAIAESVENGKRGFVGVD